MKTLAISKNISFILPKMGIMTHLVELSRHDYIYVKDNLMNNDILQIESDKSRFWEENSLAVYYKEFKLGYLKLYNKWFKNDNKYGGLKCFKTSPISQLRY